MTEMQNGVNIYENFSKRMRFLSVFTGIFIALVMPITYFVLSWNEEETKANYLSGQVSQKIVGIVKSNPKLWKFMVVKFTQVFDEVESEEIHSIKIIDSQGKVLDDETYSNFSIFSIKGRTNIVYNNTLYGYVEVWKIANNLLLLTGILFLIFSGLAAAISFVLFRYPARIIEKAEWDINGSIDKLNQLSYYDQVTQLRNRAYLNEVFPSLISKKDSFAILFLDLDNFKHINDSYGHSCGDMLLVAVSERLKSIMRIDDIIIRFGGDEFMIMIDKFNDRKSLDKVARKFILAFSRPFSLNELTLFVTTSIGIVIYPEDGKDLTLLTKHADTAMYVAKRSGKNNYSYYSSEMSKESLENVSMVNELYQALQREDFILYYQPKFDLHNNEITGCEILLRWLHPESGMIMPGEFIPVAEESGLIVPIGEWVIRKTFEQIKQWVDQYDLKPIRFSFNFSPRQFQHENMISCIKRELDRVGLDPNYLELEITESIAMQNTEEVYSKLREIKEVGLHISLDDFGTGYSSMNYLKNFPIDTLKIAMPFIQGITKEEGNDAIISAMVSLAHNLGMDVVAEGIETAEQLKLLREKGCDYGQGYIFSRPVTAEEFIRLLSCPGKPFNDNL